MPYFQLNVMCYLDSGYKTFQPVIKQVILYRVFCDLCGKLFDNEEKPLRMNECHLYTSVKRAEIGIQVAGWKVMHNMPASVPRIICPRCFKDAEKLMHND